MPSEDTYEPTVSVVVPVLNAEKTMEPLLDSLIEIDYDRQKLEIVLVDGGSKDRTREIASRYPVKLIPEDRKGLNLARNIGVKNSSGEIVLFIDSDCIAPKDWIQRIVSNFQNSEIGCVGGTVVRYEEATLSRYADESIMPVLRRFEKREVLDNIGLFSRYPAGCNMALRRNAIEKAKGFDESIHYGFDEDELVERVCNTGYMMVLDPETVVMHQHRVRLASLLKQTFNYGRGGGLLLRKKIAKDRISQWILMNLLLFIGWMIMVPSLFILSVRISHLFWFPLATITILPIILMLLVYIYKSLIGKAHQIAISYPALDMLRLLAFCFGAMYGVIGRSK